MLATTATLSKAKDLACSKVTSERAAYLRQVSQPGNYLTLPLYHGTDQHNNTK